LRLKTGEVPEGCATFYRHSKFRFVKNHDLALSDALMNDPLFSDICVKVNQSAALKEKLEQRSSCLQVSALQSIEDESKYMLVATVHLYFHPKAPHVRLVHTAVCVRHIENVLTTYIQQGIQPAVVFCGDLNSWPRSGLHEFIVTKRVSGKHADWYAGGKVEYVEGLNLSHTLDLSNACGPLPYTNYVAGFSECLDYIYHEPARLRTASVVPLPTHEEVTEHTALPSAVIPSDHLALVCDFEWVEHS